MQRKRGGLVPIGDALSGMGGPVKAIREATPQALQPSPPSQRHFTQTDQVDQLVTASEADPDLGFMARMMMLCSLPRTNLCNRHQYKRVNGPFKLIMSVTGDHKPALRQPASPASTWLCTEAVKTGSRELVLGKSLSEFMLTLGVYSSDGKAYIRLRNHMRRLFNAHVRLIYTDAHGEASVSSSVADSTAFWWNPKRPDEPMLWESKFELGEKFLQEIISHPVPIDMNTLTALKR